MYTLQDWCSACDEWTIYYVHIIAVYMFINTMANWICVKCYHSIYSISREMPGVLKPDHVIKPNHSLTHVVDMDVKAVYMNDDEHAKKYAKSKRPLSWTFCEHCNLDVPPRSHHCAICNVCILKRDHHCFFVGTCLGHFNQRYFTVCAFYLFFVGIFTTVLAYAYLRNHFFPSCDNWDLFLPVTIYRCLLGNIPVHIVMLLSHLYFMWLATVLGAGFFFWMVVLICMGKTGNEFFQQKRVANTATVWQNFREVFGDYWLLNFLFPANILFRQRTDGSTWDTVYQY